MIELLDINVVEGGGQIVAGQLAREAQSVGPKRLHSCHPRQAAHGVLPESLPDQHATGLAKIAKTNWRFVALSGKRL